VVIEGLEKEDEQTINVISPNGEDRIEILTQILEMTDFMADSGPPVNGMSHSYDVIYMYIHVYLFS